MTTDASAPTPTNLKPAAAVGLRQALADALGSVDRAIVLPLLTLSGWGTVLALILWGRDVPGPFWAAVGTLTGAWIRRAADQ